MHGNVHMSIKSVRESNRNCISWSGEVRTTSLYVYDAIMLVRSNFFIGVSVRNAPLVQSKNQEFAHEN